MEVDPGPISTSERELLPAEPIGALIVRERARLQAEERANRAEEDAAALRVALAVLTSVAEVSIEAAAHLVDEARRYGQTVDDKSQLSSQRHGWARDPAGSA